MTKPIFRLVNPEHEDKSGYGTSDGVKLTDELIERLADESEKSVFPTRKFRVPSDPLQQAWMLREYLRTGKHQLVLSCERTRQLDSSNVQSPVVVCSPENCSIPCFNCMVGILTGRKRW